MPKKSAVHLADDLCTVVLEVRQFGENNAPYLTRLENEISRRGWRMTPKRKEAIRKEIQDRGTQIDALIKKLASVLTEFGSTGPSERNILQKYWDEAKRVEQLFIDGAVHVERLSGIQVYTSAPVKFPPHKGSL